MSASLFLKISLAKNSDYFPKGESLARVSEKRVQEVYDKLNRRPRRRLGYRTPYETYCSEMLHLIEDSRLIILRKGLKPQE